ncbi:serine hydrolase domain-containing protein [Synechococcus elongatus]|uniref:serine hydrolase domain-containing protein n=1 Tax=Synechococcus elongatus TaxID=32046 RepID=UPI0030D26B1B
MAILAVVYLEALWWGHPALRPGNLASLETYPQTQLEQAEGRSFGSAALLLVRDREVVKTETFGVANPQLRSPVIADQTLYQMASVNKMVAAWGVLKLVELGKVQLQDPVLPYLNRWQFPQANPTDPEVTIAQLLSHTGGLTDQFGYAGFLPGAAANSRTITDTNGGCCLWSAAWRRSSVSTGDRLALLRWWL